MGQQVNARRRQDQVPSECKNETSRLDRHPAFNIFKSPMSAQIELGRATQDIAQEI